MSAEQDREQMALDDAVWESSPLLRFTTHYFKEIGWELLALLIGVRVGQIQLWLYPSLPR